MPLSRIGHRSRPIVAHDERGASRGASMQTVTTVPGRSRRRSTFIVACLSAAIVAALTGCAAGAANVVLPDKPGHVQVTGAKPARPSARDLLIAAYEDYWRATNEALASRAASKARAIMAGPLPARAVPAPGERVHGKRGGGGTGQRSAALPHIKGE